MPANKTKKKEPLNMDEIIKIMFKLSDKQTIGMINSLFGRNIPLDAKVTYEGNDLYRFTQEDSSVEILRTDMILNINGVRYHLEFQTLSDKTMVIRMFEYGFEISIKEIWSNITHLKDGIKLNFPKQFVIFVEQDDAIPEKELKMKVILWNDEETEFRVPIMRYWEETVDSLEEKHLVPLIPLQVFKLRKSLMAITKSKKSKSEKERLTEEKLKEVIKIYTEVSEKIRDMLDNKGELTTYDAEQILKAVQHLSKYLYSNYKSYTKIEKEAVRVSESVWSFDKWRNEGRKEGRKEGKIEGRKEGKIEGIKEGTKKSKIEIAERLLKIGLTVEQVIQGTELSEEEVMEIKTRLIH